MRYFICFFWNSQSGKFSGGLTILWGCKNDRGRRIFTKPFKKYLTAEWGVINMIKLIGERTGYQDHEKKINSQHYRHYQRSRDFFILVACLA